MRIHRIATTAAAGLTAAAIVTLGAGAATAATAEPCPGTGPAASLPAAQHDAFLKEMTALKAKRDAIMKKYGKAAPARRGQGIGQPGRGGGRGAGAALSTRQRAAMQAELATWRVSRDALFAKYGITPRNQGRSA